MRKPAVRGVLLLIVGTAGILTIAARCNGVGGGNTPPPTIGTISVSVGFGAVTSNPYQCTGNGNVTINPQNLTGTAGQNTSSTQPYSFSGFSSTTPNEPACQVSVVFGNLRPGTWQVTNGTTTCAATVVAGQLATVKIWNNVCQ